MDGDLAESISALKEAFNRRGLPSQFGRADPGLVQRLREKLRVPRRFRDFLLEAEPLDVETRTPSERLRLIPGYCDLTTVLHDRILCVRDETLEAVWPLQARGRLD